MAFLRDWRGVDRCDTDNLRIAAEASSRRVGLWLIPPGTDGEPAGAPAQVVPPRSKHERSSLHASASPLCQPTVPHPRTAKDQGPGTHNHAHCTLHLEFT